MAENSTLTSGPPVDKTLFEGHFKEEVDFKGMGEAGASSTYHNGNHEADHAFLLAGYWASANKSTVQRHIYFKFDTPVVINQIFLTPATDSINYYPSSSLDLVSFFGSNSEDCGDREILNDEITLGTHFIQNLKKYICYGFQLHLLARHTAP